MKIPFLLALCAILSYDSEVIGSEPDPIWMVEDGSYVIRVKDLYMEETDTYETHDFICDNLYHYSQCPCRNQNHDKDKLNK